MANRCYEPLNDAEDTVCQNPEPDDGEDGCVLHRRARSHEATIRYLTDIRAAIIAERDELPKKEFDNLLLHLGGIVRGLSLALDSFTDRQEEIHNGG